MTKANKTASQMLHPELAANGGTKRDIIDRLMLKPPLHNLSNEDLVEAATEIRNLRHEVESLTRTIDDLYDDRFRTGGAWAHGSD
jgi:hypothetical protein